MHKELLYTLLYAQTTLCISCEFGPCYKALTTRKKLTCMKLPQIISNSKQKGFYK